MLKENGRLWILNASKTEIREPVVDGWENVSDEPCVVATTHLTGIDPREIARILGNRRKVSLAVESGNLSSLRLGLWFHILGRNNFLPISTTDSRFRDEVADFKESINEQGKTIIVSAYTPAENWHLPEKGGIAAVTIAHAAKVDLVPAYMTYESPDVIAQGWDIPKRAANVFKNRRSATSISFCPPVELVSISSDEIDQALRSFDTKERSKMSLPQRRNTHETRSIIRDETAVMMAVLASKVPQEMQTKKG